MAVALSSFMPRTGRTRGKHSSGSWVWKRTVLVGLVSLALCSPLGAAPVEVRFIEGVTRGFLILRSTTGQVVGQGDLLQTAHPDRVESRMIFRFKDGSLYDERVVFTQQHVFTLLSYRLVEQGPSFPEPTDVSFERKTGRYQVKSVEKGREETSSGTIDLPPDVYNGMTVTILKNLPAGRSETVHHVAFTPTPRVIRLELEPAGNQRLKVGEQEGTGTRFAIKPKLGVILGIAATVMGKKPSDYECVIWTKEVPAFVRCDGPLRLKGPAYRFELTEPR
jgi:hypothetical protein